MTHFSFLFVSEIRITNKTIELGNTLKLKWNLNRIKKYDELQVGHRGNKSQLIILRQTITSYNVKMSYYETHDDPNQNRISGYLNLVNGNGTLTLNVKNIHNESGDYVMFASWKRFFLNEKNVQGGVAISVKVKGKTGPDSLPVAYIRGCR